MLLLDKKAFQKKPKSTHSNALANLTTSDEISVAKTCRRDAGINVSNI